MKVAARPMLMLSMIIAAFGCTRMPANYSNTNTRPVLAETNNNELMQLVASARIGGVETFVDPVTGLASQITVLSEYFSANGRSCRRFSQHLSNASAPRKKLGCKDSANGWREIPVSHIVDQ